MKKRSIGIIVLACLTAGIGLAGCAGSNDTTQETTMAETTTVAETTTTTAETTTTTQETTTTAEASTEAWMAKYADAAIPPRKDPEKVWDGVYKVELRLDNGIHIYVPSFFDGWYDGFEPHGNYGFGIYDTGDTDGYIDYSEYDENTHTSHYGKDYFELKSNEIKIGVHEAIIDIAGKIRSDMPEDDNVHKYKKIAEKDGKVFYIDFTTPYYSGSGYAEWRVYDGEFDEGSNLGYYNKYADMIADTAWVEKNNDSALYGSTSHPEDDVFLDYLRQYYNSHEKKNVYPVVGGGEHSYEGYSDKYAIADFDSDGENELAIEEIWTWYKYIIDNKPASLIYILEADNINNDDESAPTKSIPNGGFSDTTFYKNGVAEVNSTYDNVASAYYGEHPKGEVIDNKRYILFNDDLLQKLNYSKDNVDEYSTGYMMYYCKDGDNIHKILKKDSGDNLDVIKTPEEYEADKVILTSGGKLDLQVKDFTAENIGL